MNDPVARSRRRPASARGLLSLRAKETNMHIRSILLGFVLTACGSACAHKSPGPRSEPRAERAARPMPSTADWTRLGQRWVDGVRDADVIAVGSHDGSFQRIMIVVEHSALQMNDVIVNFTDGSRFSPPTRLVFAENSRSQIIDLPGTRRSIRSVEFRYGNLPGGGKAQTELWAQ